MTIERIIFDETGEEREIKGYCRRCYPNGEPPVEPQLVSPRGLVHQAWDYGTTDCGVDATGEKWWWRQ